MPSNFLAEMGEQIRTQDRTKDHGPAHGTSHPLYTVQQRTRLYGVDSDFHADVKRDGGILYIEFWEAVPGAVSLTRPGAEEIIRLHGRGLKDPRVYVASMFRVPEMIRLREELQKLAETDEETTAEPPPKEADNGD